MQPTARALIFSRPAVFATLVASFALVGGAGALSALSTHEITAANRRAAHAQQTLVIINQLLATITDAETAQRGYILTHDAKYLGPYEAAQPQYHSELAALGTQFVGDAASTSLVAQLTKLCDDRFAEIARTIQLRREHGIAPALNVVESDEGWRIMNEIRRRLQFLQQQELGAVASHTTSAVKESRLFQRLNEGLLALAMVLAGAVAWTVIRRLNQLEGLIKVCAWTKRVEWRGQWITFEEYLAKRFNLHVTHGISDEAARQLGREIANTPVPPDA